MNTLVVHVNDPRFKDDPWAVYIGRATARAADPRCRKPTLWKNMFVAGRDVTTKEEAIRRYEAMIRLWLRTGTLKPEQLLALDGKVLGCWCKPEACHGDVLVRLIDELKVQRAKLGARP